MSDKLNEKESDLANVKRMFVDKLRELESSFVDLSQDMIENEHVQQEVSRKYQQQVQKQKQDKNRNAELEKSIEQAIVGKYGGDDDHDS